jgi:predicted protein tyrosine phosphatase
MPERLHYLFVCYANVDRSPTAEAVYRRITRENSLAIEANSAGVSRGANRLVTKEMVDLADEIFVMEPDRQHSGAGTMEPNEKSRTPTVPGTMAGTRLRSIRRDGGLYLRGVRAPVLGLCGIAFLFGICTRLAAAEGYFTIQVLDAATGRGVPLVQLRTVNKASWWTDSNGIIAFDEPGLMDIEVFFHVSSPGYEVPEDFFHNRGVKLKPRRGDSTVIRVHHLNIAERLYRITGQGIYRDSVLAGHPVPLKQPVLNGQVMGQDTVIATPYRGKIYWFWGDTDRPSYPLGNFGASGATSELPGHGGLDPGVGVDLTYFVDESGFSKPMCPRPQSGMHWIESLFTVPDERGVERLVARMANTAELGSATDYYLMLFNDEKEIFEPIQRWDIHDPHRSAHPFLTRVDGVRYYYIYPDIRVPADLKSLAELDRYEVFTCLAGTGRWHGPETKVDRDASGHVRYTWKAGADRLQGDHFDELVKSGKLRQEETWCYLSDFDTGSPLARGLESVAWNEFRQRWIAFFADKPGEVWFAEADTPLGPWGYGRRVVTHGEYNFYNLAHHPFFNQDGGRLVYLEGTYTAAFTEAEEKGALTPRYDYNQLMYRLALDDARLALPVAVYRVRGTKGAVHLWLRGQVQAAGAWERIDRVAFFALPPTCRGEDVVPVYAVEKNGTVLSTTPSDPNTRPIFVGLPLVQRGPVTTIQGLWDCRASTVEGDEFKFPLEFWVEGETVRVSSAALDASGSGTFREGKLTLVLKTPEETFTLDGRLEARALTGTWQQEAGQPHGTWSASPPDTTPAERRSPALVELREYRRLADGGRCYSTESQPPAGCDPAGEPLCRVWKVPGAVLALDWKAKPLTDHRP